MKTETILKAQQATKSENATFLALESLKVGYTKVINGQAVTRWSYSSYEVGTFARKAQTIDEAATCLLRA